MGGGERLRCAPYTGRAAMGPLKEFLMHSKVWDLRGDAREGSQ